MKALTLHQPYASLVALGVKTIETRSWRAPRALIGQRIAIHAAQTLVPWSDLWRDAHERRGQASIVLDALRTATPWWTGSGWYVDGAGVQADEWFGPRETTLLPLGAVVATAVLTDCIPMVAVGRWMGKHVDVQGGGAWLWESPDSGDCTDISDQLPFGVFAPGRWAWLLADVEALAEPVPAKGRQGVWTWEPIGVADLCNEYEPVCPRCGATVDVVPHLDCAYCSKSCGWQQRIDGAAYVRIRREDA